MGLDPRDPHELAHRDWTVLLTHPDGGIPGSDGCGLYHHDCRIVSHHRLTVDGQQPDWVSGGADDPDVHFASLRVKRPGGDPAGPHLPHDALEIRVRRLVGDGMVEEIDVLNHSMVATTCEMSIEIAADFADVLEVGQQRRQQEGETQARVTRKSGSLTYRATNGEYSTQRGVRVRALDGRLRVAGDDRSLRVTAAIDLPAQGTWRARLAYEALVDGKWHAAAALTPAWARVHAERRAWRKRRPRIVSTSPTLQRIWDVAADDVFDVRNRELERLSGEPWVVNAGLPLYTGLFGRDALTCGWQAALLTPRIMRGALAVTAALQADTDDAWLDAEPGKLIHELRRGPLADLRITAQAGYYGTQTTAAMFPLVLTELWHWTGDDSLLDRYRTTAERAMEWANRYGDLDGDGFLEYEQRSPVGIKNQAWKDSHEALRYPDGSIVPNPIAAVEEQAFHYLALCRTAEMCVVLGDETAAESYLERARVLRTRWHEAFWVESLGFYAMALDADKRHVESIGSNAGHALASGIVPRELARSVSARLMAPDMHSGWGVRTLSTEHPSFNPWAYHLGTVWPVENATFALGFKRYGFDDLVDRTVKPMLDAAALMPDLRLPELIGGQAREETGVPIAYPEANAPQAWSASATIQLIQIMLGLYPFAPLRVLALVRPRLPEGIDDLTLHDVRVGRARVSLRFRRRPDGSASHEVVERVGSLLVVEAPPPDAADLDFREQVASVALAHAPGRLARAGRLALGLID